MNEQKKKINNCFKLIKNMEINGRTLHNCFLEGKFFIKVIIIIRTDNAIKNHFYSTLRRSLRRINKYLGDKNSFNCF